MRLLKPDTCRSCLGWKWGCDGYVPADGDGSKGVLVILEAAGEHEAEEGIPTVGKAGYFLWQNLKRIGIEREGFMIHNVLSCQPPKNKLAGMPYEAEVIKSCAPNLDATIDRFKHVAAENGKTPVILTLGKISFKRIMGVDEKDPIMKVDYLCYPLWSDRYQCWVMAADHPSYLMRGQTHLLPVLQFAFQRALEIAEQGLTLDEGIDYLLDPEVRQFDEWVDGYERELSTNPEGCFLSYDIETPHKSGEDEEKLAKDEDDYTILQCSFAYNTRDGGRRTVSARWGGENRALFERVFGSSGPKLGWNSQAYDDPRIIAQMPINGIRYDAMQMWHVLNSALPKGLGFVTPFYVHNTGMWKHLSNSRPSFYNAKDADMALQNFLGIKKDLEDNKLWPVYLSHIVKVHEVFNYMGQKGVPLDLEMRAKAEAELSVALDELEKQMELAVPEEVKSVKVYKKFPRPRKCKSCEGTGILNKGKPEEASCSACQGLGTIEVTGLKEETRPVPVEVCSGCGLVLPKRWKKHATLCGGASTPLDFPQTVWVQTLDFKLSKKGLLGYQNSLKHAAITDRKKGTITFDEKAILQLVKKYPEDPLYPLILEFRGLQKLLGTYIGTTQAGGRIKGGLPTGPDGRVHTLFTSNPSTLRSASQNPNLQNIPRPSKRKDETWEQAYERDPGNYVRNLFVAPEGHILLARDFSGIEARLVGYFANAPDYIRLTGLDVHSFYTAYAINALDGRIRTADLPQLSWTDSRLKDALAQIKKEFSADRNNLYKHLVHAINFGQTAKGAQEKILAETGVAYPVATIQRVMDLYKELFPEIPRWHRSVLLEAESNGYLKNPFGYVHRFTRPFDYQKIGGLWQKKQGPDANKCWAFLPQSTAAGIIKEAMLRLYHNHFEEAGQYLRLLIHDELFLEVPEPNVHHVDAILKAEMEAPILAMPCPSSWNLGTHLNVGTEEKMGKRWGAMK